MPCLETNAETPPIILNISQLILKYFIFLPSQMKDQQTLTTKFYLSGVGQTAHNSVVCFLDDSSFGVLNHVIDTCFHLPNWHDVIYCVFNLFSSFLYLRLRRYLYLVCVYCRYRRYLYLVYMCLWCYVSAYGLLPGADQGCAGPMAH